MKPSKKRVLDIAVKNGWKNVDKTNDGYKEKCLLACDKSFLGALTRYKKFKGMKKVFIRKYCKRDTEDECSYWFNGCDDFFDYKDNWTCFKLEQQIQKDIIHDLTNNNGKNFWKICAEFIGGKR